jgi:hypothetical protein
MDAAEVGDGIDVGAQPIDFAEQVVEILDPRGRNVRFIFPRRIAGHELPDSKECRIGLVGCCHIGGQFPFTFRWFSVLASLV